MADDSLAGLAARVAALEDDAGVQPSFAPLAGMQVQPDGSIAYDFDGHVHAKGLDLDAGATAGSTADDNKLRWLAQPDGSMVAELAGFNTGDGGAAGTFKASDGTNSAELSLSTQGGTPAAYLNFEQDLAVRSLLLADIDGLSDFVKIADPNGIGANMRLAWGTGVGAWGGNLLNVPVNHGLSRTPDVALAALWNNGIVFYSTHFVGVSDWTDFEVTFTWSADAGVSITDGATSNFGWLCGVTQ